MKIVKTFFDKTFDKCENGVAVLVGPAGRMSRKCHQASFVDDDWQANDDSSSFRVHSKLVYCMCDDCDELVTDGIT